MHVVIGISGGIAAVKVLRLIQQLVDKKIDVSCIVTESAAKIIDTKELEILSPGKVFSRLFSDGYSTEQVLSSRHVEHIDVADKADLMIIVPTTANTLAKLASGIADDFLTTTVLATQAPILICPSMNVHMWQHPVVQKNVLECKMLGYHFLDPVSGSLACGYEGIGRLPETEIIVEKIERFLNRKKLLSNKKILITSGGTQESIDDVRVITNKSSGKMGAALADAAFTLGADVTFIRSKNSVPARYVTNEHFYETAEELEQLLEKYIPEKDICFHAAAVSDFKITKQDGKIDSSKSLSLQLVPREKIYKKIKQWNQSLFLVTFKAESNLSPEQWNHKLSSIISSSEVNAVIGNDIGKKDQGFQSDTNAAIVYCRDGRKKEFPLMPKTLLAEELLEFIFTDEK